MVHESELQSNFIGSAGRSVNSKPPSNCAVEFEVEVEANGNSTASPQNNELKLSECGGIAVYRRSKRLRKQGNDDAEVETVNSVNSSGKLVIPASENGVVSQSRGKAVLICEPKGGLAGVKADGGELVEVRIGEDYGRDVGLFDRESVVLRESCLATASSRLTRRSSQKRKTADNGDPVLESEVCGSENNGGEVESASNTFAKKMELKMSKKIAFKGRPSTVKELFETGLLEGYPVFYNGGKRGFPLRGTIKDIGILCSCSSCQGSKVIPPCQFEIHACKFYRRASQYICFENGKSLLEVVKACRKTSSGTLEEIICCVVGPLPSKESTVCLNCNRSFLATCATKLDRLCDSCVILLKPEVNSPCPLQAKDGSTTERLTSKFSEPVEVFVAYENDGQDTKRKTSVRPLLPNTSESSSLHSPSEEKDQSKIKKKLSRLAVPPSSSKSSSACVSKKNKSRWKILKKSPKIPSSLKPSRSPSISASPKNKAQWKITKKDQRMHKLVFEDGGLPNGTELAYYSRGKKLLEGYKKGSGIHCCCCNSEVSPSTFEAHAGWASRRKPYLYIYTSNGVSLHELAISLLKGRNYVAKENDDLCIICADGGDLVLCDGCPRAFHKECASLSSIPRGKWFCKYCQNMFQREKFVQHNANALAAGRASGVDPIEQIANRCIRIVKTPEEAEVIACVLCRGYDFSKSGFGPRTVILCDQCEKEYHVGCLKKLKMADLKELPKGKWFCCVDCRRIYSVLQNLLISGEEKLPDLLLDIIRKKYNNNGLDSYVTHFNVSWRLLSGKVASRETKLLLSEAVSIFHDCFDPIVDSVTGRDFIPSLVYGRNIRGQDFGGMFCAILTVNSHVVSAGILRIFGQDVAELPLVATRRGNQGKGYFQLLFSCIEKLLSSLDVRSILLPAAEEAKSIWTEKFGFERVPAEQLRNYKRNFWQMISFKGTSMLEKPVPPRDTISLEAAALDMQNALIEQSLF